jgi:hypothetical protein
LFRDADLLARGTGDGSYGPKVDPQNPTRGGDTFHTAYAMLGVSRGETGGAAAGDDYWRRELMWWLRAQNRDGGWGAYPGEESRHVNSIAAAVSVLTCLNHLGRSRDEALRHGGMQSALRWIEANYNNGRNSDPLHFLYGVGRLGAALGTRKIGESDWYDWASRDLIRHQREDGLWAPRGKPPYASTALGLLTLCHARAGH